MLSQVRVQFILLKLLKYLGKYTLTLKHGLCETHVFSYSFNHNVIKN